MTIERLKQDRLFGRNGVATKGLLIESLEAKPFPL